MHGFLACHLSDTSARQVGGAPLILLSIFPCTREAQLHLTVSARSLKNLGLFCDWRGRVSQLIGFGFHITSKGFS